MIFTRLIILSGLTWICSAGPISRLAAIRPEIVSTDAPIYGVIVPASFAGDIVLETAAASQDDGITVTPVTPPWLVSSTSVSMAEPSTSEYPRPSLTEQSASHSKSPESPQHLEPSMHLGDASIHKSAVTTPSVHSSMKTPVEVTLSKGTGPTSLPKETTSAGQKEGSALTQTGSKTSSPTAQAAHTHASFSGTAYPHYTGAHGTSKDWKHASSTPLKYGNSKPHGAESTGHVKRPCSSETSSSKNTQTTNSISGASLTTSSSTTKQTPLTAGIVAPLYDTTSSVATGDSLQTSPSRPAPGDIPATTTSTSPSQTSPSTDPVTTTTETITVHHTTTENLTITVPGPTITVTPRPPAESASITTTDIATTKTKTKAHLKPATVESKPTTTAEPTAPSITFSFPGPTFTLDSPIASKKTSDPSSSESRMEPHKHHPEPTAAPTHVSNSDDSDGITVTPVTPAGFITVTVTKTVTVTETPSGR